MTHAFSRTLRSVESDRSRLGVLSAVAAIAILAAWSAWLVRARVPVFAESRTAKLVTERAVYPVESPVPGRVAEVPVELGQPVAAGALLVQLDDREARLARDEELARAEALRGRIEGTRGVLAARERARGEARAAAAAAVSEARLVRESRVLEKRIAEEELARLERLRESSVSELSVSQARTAVEKAGVAIRGQDAAIERLELEQRRMDSERAAELETLRRDLASDEGTLAAARAAAGRLELEIERLAVRAPAAGVVGELPPIAPGTYVAAGARLGTVVAGGPVAVRASFAPSEALGRVRAGQDAELALDGFPRLEYGALPLRVARVASEARDGGVQVELALADGAPPSLPVEHGLPGRVRIEVERVSPAALVLRAIGGALAMRPAPGGGSARAPAAPGEPGGTGG